MMEMWNPLTLGQLFFFGIYAWATWWQKEVGRCFSGLVWFMLKVALPKIWLAKISVHILLTNEFVNIGYKNKLELAVEHWHTKKSAAIQTHTNFLVIANKLVRYSLVTIQTCPQSFSFGSC
jgi:hypothetical protein